MKLTKEELILLLELLAHIDRNYWTYDQNQLFDRMLDESTEL